MHVFSTGSQDTTLPTYYDLGSTPTILATKPSQEGPGADLELHNAITGEPIGYGADTVKQNEVLEQENGRPQPRRN